MLLKCRATWQRISGIDNVGELKFHVNCVEPKVRLPPSFIKDFYFKFGNSWIWLYVGAHGAGKVLWVIKWIPSDNMIQSCGFGFATQSATPTNTSLQLFEIGSTTAAASFNFSFT